MKEIIEEKLWYALQYDKEHHCFKWFVLGFEVATLFVEILMLIKKS